MKNPHVTFTAILFALTCFGLLPTPKSFGVVPPPDGGYPGGNTAEGQSALFSLTSGTFNTAVGFLSLRSNTEGNFNTAIGAGALLANTADANENTATGAGTLLSNTIGSGSTANGAFALFNNTEGSSNTAIGDKALFLNTIGSANTATGAVALQNNTEGVRNTANGSQALELCTTGSDNTATGAFALKNNTEGRGNTANGAEALLTNTTGDLNTANGSQALHSNTTGDRNTAIGNSALVSNVTGSFNTAFGDHAGNNVTTANNVICIGHPGANVDSSCFIGNIYQKQVGADSLPVRIDSFGKLGTEVSSKRFKRDIKPMDHASEAILALKPVAFHYNSDNTNTPQFGLIAEEVARVNADLVVHDNKGQVYTVRYDAVNAMLLNEFLKEHSKVQQLEATVAQQRNDFETTITELKKEMKRVAARFEEQDPRIQKISTRVELSEVAARTTVSAR
jgi:hypothetical protein